MNYPTYILSCGILSKPCEINTEGERDIYIIGVKERKTIKKYQYIFKLTSKCMFLRASV